MNKTNSRGEFRPKTITIKKFSSGKVRHWKPWPVTWKLFAVLLFRARRRNKREENAKDGNRSSKSRCYTKLVVVIGVYHQIGGVPRIPEHFLDPKYVKLWWFSIATPDRRKTNTTTQFTSPSAPQKRPTCSSCSRSTSQVTL